MINTVLATSQWIIKGSSMNPLHVLNDLNSQPPGFFRRHRADLALRAQVEFAPCNRTSNRDASSNLTDHYKWSLDNSNIKTIFVLSSPVLAKMNDLSRRQWDSNGENGSFRKQLSGSIFFYPCPTILWHLLGLSASTITAPITTCTNLCFALRLVSDSSLTCWYSLAP